MQRVYHILIFICVVNSSWGQEEPARNTPQNTNNSELKEIETEQKVKNVEKKLRAKPTRRQESVQETDKPQQIQTNSPNGSQKVSYESMLIGYQNLYNNYSRQRTRRSFTNAQLVEMQTIVDQMSSNYPKRAETSFAFYQLGQHDLTRGPALLFAATEKVNDQEIKKHLAVYQHLMNKKDETRHALMEIFQKGMYPIAVKDYALDVLLSCPPNATLIVHGMEDAIGALYVQEVMRKREDVKVISLEWLNSEQFKAQLKREGYAFPKSEMVDVSYFGQFINLNEAKRIYVALTLPKEYLQINLGNLFLNGLTFEFSSVSRDLSLNNEILWQSKFEKIILVQSTHPLSANYLPLLLQLKQQYQEKGNTKKVEELDAQIDFISAKLGLGSKMKSLK